MDDATARACGLALGHTADLLLGDPRRHHPVAWFGTVATMVENRFHRDDRTCGAVAAFSLIGASALIGAALDAATRGRPVARIATTALATWIVLGGRSLVAEGNAISDLLTDDDLAGARVRIRNLVGRDPDDLDATELARAAVESIAENTSDAVVAPLLWGGSAGIAGLLGHRASNTLDAMWGHRSPRLLRFGWAAARLDDAANLIGSRLCAILTTALAPIVGGRPTSALRAWREDAAKHPSPNAGPVEAAFAGALGVQLGGRNSYGGRVDDRGTLGDGPPPCVEDLARVNRLATAVGLGALVMAMAIPLGLAARAIPPGLAARAIPLCHTPAGHDPEKVSK